MYFRDRKYLGLVQEILRTDHENETFLTTAAHFTLKQDADVSRNGTSAANQRIESF